MDHSGHEHAFEFLFHPVLVHFPIAFYALELLLLVLWVYKKSPEHHRFALFVFRLGYLGMIAAMIAGYVDAGGWGEIVGPVRRHFYAALAVFTIYTVKAFYWKFANQEKDAYARIQIALGVLGNATIVYAGFLGGELVYG